MVTAVTFPVAFLPFLASTGYCGILWDLGCRSTPRTVSVFFFRLSIGEGLPFCHGQPFFLISPGFWSGRKLAFKSPGPQNGPRCRWRWVEIWVSKDHFSVEKNVFCFVRLSYPEAKQKLANSFQLRKTLTRIRMYGGCRWISILVFRNGIKKGWTMVYLYIYIIIKKANVFENACCLMIFVEVIHYLKIIKCFLPLWSKVGTTWPAELPNAQKSWLPMRQELQRVTPRPWRSFLMMRQGSKGSTWISFRFGSHMFECHILVCFNIR